jgi:hypothetical protein
MLLAPLLRPEPARPAPRRWPRRRSCTFDAASSAHSGPDARVARPHSRGGRPDAWSSASRPPVARAAVGRRCPRLQGYRRARAAQGYLRRRVLLHRQTRSAFEDCSWGLPAEADRTPGPTPWIASSPSGYLHDWRFQMGVIRGLARLVGGLLLGVGGLLRGVLGGVGRLFRRLV